MKHAQYSPKVLEFFRGLIGFVKAATIKSGKLFQKFNDFVRIQYLVDFSLFRFTSFARVGIDETNFRKVESGIEAHSFFYIANRSSALFG